MLSCLALEQTRHPQPHPTRSVFRLPLGVGFAICGGPRKRQMAKEQILTDIPNWLLLHLTVPRGDVLPKKSVVARRAEKVPDSRLLPAHYQPGSNHLTPPPREFGCGVKVKVDASGGNLNNTEYQFYVGQKWVMASYRCCRACRRSLYTLKEQLDHAATTYGNQSCAKWVVEAIKILGRRHECVICGTNTIKRFWGVPLCSVACLHDWKFIPKDWPRMVAALLEAGWKYGRG